MLVNIVDLKDITTQFKETLLQSPQNFTIGVAQGSDWDAFKYLVKSVGAQL